LQLVDEPISYPNHVGILGKLGINIEEHRHVDLLVGVQALLLKAKALDLVEVDTNLAGMQNGQP